MIRAVYQHLYGLVRRQALNCSLSFTSRCLRSVLFVCVRVCVTLAPIYLPMVATVTHQMLLMK